MKNRNYLYLPVCCLLALLAYSCTKSKKQPLPGFTVSSNLYINKAIRFSGYNVPANCTWSFGDGGTAQGQNAIHTYTTPGKYTVSLQGSVSQTIYIVTDSDVIASLAGTYTMHRIDEVYEYTPSGLKVFPQDTGTNVNVEIRVPSPSTLIFNGETLEYNSFTPPTFTFTSSSPVGSLTPYSVTLTINTATGSRQYTKNVHLSAAGNETITYSTL